MIRQYPACRAVLLATGLVLATMSPAFAGSPGEAEADAAAEAAPAVVEEEPAEPFSPTIYFGPQFGLADQDGTEFGWAFDALMRPLAYLAIQIEYLNLGSQPNSSGEHDFGYFGLSPMYPVIPHTLDLFAQVGLVVGDAGDDVAAGAGALYTLPIEFLDQNNVDLALQLDYKYLNIDDGNHLVTFGFLLGFHK